MLARPETTFGKEINQQMLHELSRNDTEQGCFTKGRMFVCADRNVATQSQQKKTKLKVEDSGERGMRQVIGVTFGRPLAYKTFSGYSRHLFLTMQELGALQAVISTKQIRARDFWDGCVNWAPLRDLKRPKFNVHWLWNPLTIHRLSQRLQRRLGRFDEAIPVLQVGTHAYALNTSRKFYCVTDMTVKQAVDSGHFQMSQLRHDEACKAIDAQKRMFDSCEKTFVLCQWTWESVVNDYAQSPDKVVVVGAGANMPELEPSESKYSSHQILFVGYDWVRKGGPLLVDAFRLVRKQIPNATVNIVGSTPKIFEEGVKVIGSVNKATRSGRAKIERLYQEANCFCILPDFDPFPNALIEAQATGTPVISLATGSRDEAVKDNVTGILVKKRDCREVAAALLKILSDPNRAHEMGLAGRKLVLHKFTWQNVVENILSHIWGDGRGGT